MIYQWSGMYIGPETLLPTAPGPDHNREGTATMAKRVIRPIRIEGNVAYVPLTKGYEAIIDACDAPLVAGYNWCATVNRNTVYAARNEKRRTVLMHAVFLPKRGGYCTDHIDGNGLNNCRSNLRYATTAQNAHNSAAFPKNKHGLVGVSWHKKRRKWVSLICVKGKRYNLGDYTTPEQANAAYLSARRRMCGTFAKPLTENVD
jgi:hypothetical protein